MINTTLGKIIYSDDDIYRSYISQIFKIPIAEIDDYSFEPAFDYIYDKTEDEPFFKWAYTTAAGFMLSEDPKLGVCVLFAYDYAATFYEVLCVHLNCGPIEDLDRCKKNLETLLRKPTVSL